MISSQPERLLRFLLPSIGDGNNFIALKLGGLTLKLECVEKTTKQLTYSLSIIEFSFPSVDEPEERVLEKQNIVSVLTKESCPYKHVAEYVCKAVPQYVIMHKGMEAERSLAQCQLYILETQKGK